MRSMAPAMRRASSSGPEVLDGPAEALEVQVQAADLLVGRPRCVAGVDAGLVPGHAPHLGLGVTLGQPGPGEPRVVGAAGPLLAPQVVDDRERGDGRQAAAGRVAATKSWEMPG